MGLGDETCTCSKDQGCGARGVANPARVWGISHTAHDGRANDAHVVQLVCLHHSPLRHVLCQKVSAEMPVCSARTWASALAAGTMLICTTPTCIQSADEAYVFLKLFTIMSFLAYMSMPKVSV